MSANIPKPVFIGVVVALLVIIGLVGYFALRPAPIRMKTAEELSKMERKPVPPPPVIPGM